MSDKLDKPLDQLIKEEKMSKRKEKKSFPKKQGASGFKKDRAPREHVNKRGGFRDRNSTRGGDRKFTSSRDKGRKVRVVNLDYNILEEDVREIFASVGKLKFCRVLWDKQGRSLGKALVKYEYDTDHAKAIKEFNGAELDGRVLTVEYDN
mmetsp:Transcript_1638/g.1809  ORF Transcript_1638/g.1809 Transcript_1638/m.1809 type:complete len:150 (-) Transcript_1638:217-666(-)|eukprot:CAMPEP_0205823830 /NCGR_PEP_ID=MMETSP0206-20130828/18037_1 /ASSEMBLY_ACC=CAM_ASM_000279 /TAXON_ID=36767 /ORGANISM="Euplotes focardii, Strain TN1" /LENGTH=149 /DNA_ID=CAMNT_0053121329 /DNA_START=24 /DNA_END=473 /DNA_ORIENTATION=-